MSRGEVAEGALKTRGNWNRAFCSQFLRLFRHLEASSTPSARLYLQVSPKTKTPTLPPPASSPAPDAGPEGVTGARVHIKDLGREGRDSMCRRKKLHGQLGDSL